MSRLRGARVRVKGGKGDRTRKGWGEVIRSDNLDWGLYKKTFSVWESSWTKQRGYIENKGVFVRLNKACDLYIFLWLPRVERIARNFVAFLFL